MTVIIGLVALLVTGALITIGLIFGALAITLVLIVAETLIRMIWPNFKGFAWYT